MFSNSANACNSFMRSFGSFALAISSHKIVSSLGFNWGGACFTLDLFPSFQSFILDFTVSLFGFLSFGLVPIPLIFLRYGKRLRSRSYYAKEAARIVSEMNVSRDETANGSERELDDSPTFTEEMEKEFSLA